MEKERRENFARCRTKHVNTILRWMQTSCNRGPAAPGRFFTRSIFCILRQWREQLATHGLAALKGCCFLFFFFSDAQPAEAKRIFLDCTGCGSRCESKLGASQFRELDWASCRRRAAGSHDRAGSLRRALRGGGVANCCSSAAVLHSILPGCVGPSGAEAPSHGRLRTSAVPGVAA